MSATGSKVSIPEGWRRLSDYCIARDGWTICKIGLAEGWRYELWLLKNQVVVGLSSAELAILEWSKRATTSSSSAPAPGPKSSPLQAGDQAELL